MSTETADKHTAAYQKESAWFERRCAMYAPLWQWRIAKGVAEGKGTEEELAERFAQNSADELRQLETEINLMLTRTAAIVAVATLLFAAVTLGLNDKATAIRNFFLVCSLLTTGIAFVISVKPLAPPLMRALKEAYVPSEYWTLQVDDYFTQWVINCYLTNRRKPVATAYKKAHAIGVRVLVLASVLILVRLTLGV